MTRAIAAPELCIEIDDTWTDAQTGRALPFISLSIDVQTVEGMPVLSLSTRRLPRIDIAQLNSVSDPRYEEFQRIYGVFNEARKQLFKKINADPALRVHRDVVREALLRRLDETEASCIRNQESSLLFLRFVAENFFQCPYRLFLTRYPSLFHVVSEEEFLLKIHGLRKEWREQTRAAAIHRTNRACAQRTAYRFVQTGIEKFAAECILDPSKDTRRRPQPGTKMSVQEVVPIDSGGHLAIEERGAELLLLPRLLIESAEQIIHRLAGGDAETEKTLTDLCDTEGVDSLADLARWQRARAGLPEPTERQLSNLARDFRAKHKLIERAIESGLARDVGYTGAQIQGWRRTGKPPREKLSQSPRLGQKVGESTGRPNSPETLLRALLNASTTVHCDRIAGQPVYGHDPTQEPPVLRVAPFRAAEGPLRVLYSPRGRRPGAKGDELLDSESTVGGGKNLHADLLYMVDRLGKMGRGQDKRKSEVRKNLGIAPITPRSWVSMPRMAPLTPVASGASLASALHKVVLKPVPLEGIAPDPGVAMRPVTGVSSRPSNYSVEALPNGALVGNISRTFGEPRLNNLPHDDALEAANRDRIYSDDRYGYAKDLPKAPLGTAGVEEIQRYPLAKDADVPAELRFKYLAPGPSRPPRETEQDRPWLPCPYPRKYVDTPTPGEDEHSTRGLRLSIDDHAGRRVYAIAWPRSAGLRATLEDWWLARLLLKVALALGHKYRPFGFPSNVESFTAALPVGKYKLVNVLNDCLKSQPV